MNRFPTNTFSPGSDGDVPGETGRAAVTHGPGRAAPETTWPSSSTHSGAGSATRARVSPILPWSRSEILDVLEDILALVFLILIGAGGVLIAGVLG